MGKAETKFTQDIEAFLASKGCWYVKFHGNMYTRDGVPDLLCCINGLFVGIEVKAPNGTKRALQRYEISEIRKADGLAFFLYPKDFDDFKRWVEHILTSSPDHKRAHDTLPDQLYVY